MMVMRIHGKDLTRAEIGRHAGDMAAIGGVRALVADDGAERGIRVLQFRTGGGLSFDVLVDRAMDIGRAEFDDVSIGWASATGFRHPGLHGHGDEGGLSLLRSMSGLLVTAGLDHTLVSEEVDASQYRYGPRPTATHGVHGRVANLPARLIGYGEDWHDEGCVLWAEGEVRQAAVFGEHLRLRRRIEADMGGTEIRLSDTVVNAGFDLTPHMLLYHINVGWPLLDEGSRLEAEVDSTVWQSDSVTDQGVAWDSFPGPQPGFVEEVFEHVVRPGAGGRASARLVNDRLGRSFEVDWDPVAMPSFLEWLHLREGAYVVGLEPSTHHAAGDAAARADGTMIWLGHDEARHYRTVLRFGRA
jgi:hypothetical protein